MIHLQGQSSGRVEINFLKIFFFFSPEGLQEAEDSPSPLVRLAKG